MLQRIEQPRSLTQGDLVFLSRDLKNYELAYQRIEYELTALQVDRFILLATPDEYQWVLKDCYGREHVYSNRHVGRLYRWYLPLNNLVDAVACYEQYVKSHADAGDTAAMYALAQYYYHAPTRDLNVFHAGMRQAKVYFEQACEAGHALASFQLSQLYYLLLSDAHMLHFKDQREQEHQFYLQRSARQGYATAQYNLAYYFEYAEHGFENNDQQAVYWYTQAAQQDYAEAWNNLADKYERGRGVQRDYVKAAQHYQRAIDFNIVEAMYNLGRLYLRGLGVPKDEAQGIRLLNDAAQRGYAPARRKLKSLQKSAQ